MKALVLMCAGCECRAAEMKGEEGKLVTLSCCAHVVHVGARERLVDLHQANPFFQFQHLFTCVRIQHVRNDFLILSSEENPAGRLVCPQCLAVLTEHDVCMVLGTREVHLNYGQSRESSMEVRQAVRNVVEAFSPEHVAHFEVKPAGTTAGPAVPLRGMSKVKAMVEFYRANPHVEMTARLMDIAFDANLSDEDMATFELMLEQLTVGENATLFASSNVQPAGTGYGGNEKVCNAELNRNVTRQQERENKLEAAMKELQEALIRGGNGLGVTTEAILRKDWGVLSCLREFLGNSNINDLERSPTLYAAMVEVCICFASNPFLSPLLLSSEPLNHTVKWSAESALAKVKHCPSLAPTVAAAAALEEEDTKFATLKESITNLLTLLDSPTRAEQCLHLLANGPVHPFFVNSAGGGKEEAINRARVRAYAVCHNPLSSIALLRSAYASLLKHYQFRMLPFKELGIPHTSAGAYNAQQHRTREWQRAVNGTLANLRSSLPLEWSSSVFCAVDEANTNLLLFLIIGPEDSEYQNGCFYFEMTLSDDFPNQPPKVVFKTTGGGRVRFNPNLYACGKVCLSLLGTWSGPGWNPKESTVLQVMLSIQSLVMCKEPYYNEPGYVRPAQGKDPKSLAYSSDIRFYTLREAMMDSLLNPPKCFEQVIVDHFTMKRIQIVHQLDAWNRIQCDTSIADKFMFQRLRNEFVQVLEKL